MGGATLQARDNNGPSFGVVFLLVEAVIILFYGLFTTYGEDVGSKTGAQDNAAVTEYYPMYQDVHVMIFIGFGFLMSFLRRYGYGAVALTFLLACVAVQWSILTQGFWNNVLGGGSFHKIPLAVLDLIFADFAAAAVLISLGGVIGKLSPTQLMVMMLVEVVAYTLNNAILVELLYVADVGGSMVIHAFGAYFGLACALVATRGTRYKEHKENSGIYHSNLFSLIGTIFLFLYWPSFNAAPASSVGNGHHRAVINTLLAITTSAVTTFMFSTQVRGYRFDIVDIQNATLAGGVAIGASANMYTTPWGAMFVGLVAGAASTLGFRFVQPFLADHVRLNDTCGIHNLHGVPGVIGGVASAIFAGLAGPAQYGQEGLLVIFPKRDERSATEQAGYQMIGLLTSVGIALLSGACTGFVLKRCFKRVETPFCDDAHFIMPHEEIPFYFAEPTGSHEPAAKAASDQPGNGMHVRHTSLHKSSLASPLPTVHDGYHPGGSAHVRGMELRALDDQGNYSSDDLQVPVVTSM